MQAAICLGQQRQRHVSVLRGGRAACLACPSAAGGPSWAAAAWPATAVAGTLRSSLLLKQQAQCSCRWGLLLPGS